MKKCLAPVLVVCSVVSLRADTFLVLPFFNRTNSQNLDWIGESISETIRESLAGQGLVVLEREDRLEAYRRLSVRPNVLLTHATVVKLGSALDAGTVIYGEYTLTPPPGVTVAPQQPPEQSQDKAAHDHPSSSGCGGEHRTLCTLRITAHLLDLRRMREGPEFPEIGALEDLAFLQTHLAWETLEFVIPKAAPSEQDFRKKHPAIRVDAVENYTRGLLAGSPEEKKIFWLRAARLDPDYSQASYQLGKLFYERKDYKSAGDWLQKVAPSDTDYHEANFLLGLCRFHLSDYAGAQTAFALVAKAVPLNEVLNDLGAAQSRLDSPEAADTFKKALDGDPSDPDYQFNLGYALWKRGEFDAAEARFQAVLERDHKDTQAKQLMELCRTHTPQKKGEIRTRNLERLKTAYEESAYWQLKAVLQSDKPAPADGK